MTTAAVHSVSGPAVLIPGPSTPGCLLVTNAGTFTHFRLAFSRYSFSFKFVFRRTVFMELVIFAIGDSRVFSIDYLC